MYPYRYPPQRPKHYPHPQSHGPISQPDFFFLIIICSTPTQNASPGFGCQFWFACQIILWPGVRSNGCQASQRNKFDHTTTFRQYSTLVSPVGTGPGPGSPPGGRRPSPPGGGNGILNRHGWEVGPRGPALGNDSSAGSPTETLLRMLLLLKGQECNRQTRAY